jgi:ferredoxin
VSFVRSGLTVRWPQVQRSLLELAEACDVGVGWSCRSGVCQSCEATLLSGTVRYAPEPIATPSPGGILLCCAQPTADVELDL